MTGPALNGPRSIIFVELPRQIKRSLAMIGRRPDRSFTIVALTPHVEYELEKLGHPHRRPEDYHDEDDINTVGIQDGANLQEMSDYIDRYLDRESDLLEETELRPAILNVYYLKNLINSISIRAFILKRVLQAEQPDQVLYFGTRSESISRNLFFHRESCWSLVIPLVADSLGIHRESLGGNSDLSELNNYGAIQRSGFRSQLSNRIRKLIGPSGTIRIRKAIVAYRLCRQRLSRAMTRATPNSLPTVLSLENASNVGHLLREIESQNSCAILHWNGRPGDAPRYRNSSSAQKNETYDPAGISTRHLQQRGKDVWNAVKNIREFRRFFLFWEVDCFPAVERRMRRFFEIDVPEMVLTYFAARSMFDTWKPKAVLAAGMGDYGNHVVALAAHKDAVPFIVYQHGSNRGYVQMESRDLADPAQFFMERVEMLADYVLVFGEGDAAFMAQGDQAKSRIVPIGSAALDQVKKFVAISDKKSMRRKWGLSEEKWTVMYVPPVGNGNSRVAPYHSRSPSTQYQMQLKFLEVFGEFPEIQFVVKLHPSVEDPCSAIAQVIKDRGPDNCIAVMDPLPRILPMADMFISDHGSTAFLEMLTTDSPILFCGHQMPWPWAPGKWHPSVLEMWTERVAYSDDLDEFLELLRSYLRESRFEAVKSNNTLLKQFGTHLDDGKSAQRAHEFIMSLSQPKSEAG